MYRGGRGHGDDGYDRVRGSDDPWARRKSTAARRSARRASPSPGRRVWNERSSGGERHDDGTLRGREIRRSEGSVSSDGGERVLRQPYEYRWSAQFIEDRRRSSPHDSTDESSDSEYDSHGRRGRHWQRRAHGRYVERQRIHITLSERFESAVGPPDATGPPGADLLAQTRRDLGGIGERELAEVAAFIATKGPQRGLGESVAEPKPFAGYARAESPAGEAGPARQGASKQNVAAGQASGKQRRVTATGVAAGPAAENRTERRARRAREFAAKRAEQAAGARSTKTRQRQRSRSARGKQRPPSPTTGEAAQRRQPSPAANSPAGGAVRAAGSYAAAVTGKQRSGTAVRGERRPADGKRGNSGGSKQPADTKARWGDRSPSPAGAAGQPQGRDGDSQGAAPDGNASCDGGSDGAPVDVVGTDDGEGDGSGSGSADGGEVGGVGNRRKRNAQLGLRSSPLRLRPRPGRE